jgi:hypothetical protein
MCALLLASASRADRTEAAARYAKAVSFYKEGDYASALAEFRAAYDAAPAWEVLFNIGLTERRLFKYGQAVQTFNRYLAEGGAKVPKDRRKDVEKELEQVRALTAAITFKVEGEPATVFIDGDPIGTSPMKEPQLLSPGEHVFRAERTGARSEDKRLTLVSGTALQVALSPKALIDDGPVLISFESSPTGAVLTIDGRLGGVAPTVVPLKPGSHEVLADLDGYATARTDVVVTAGQARRVTLALEQSVGSAMEQRSGGRTKVPVAGLVIGAVGLGLIGGGVALNVSAAGASREVAAFVKAGGTWDAKYQGIEQGGQRSSTWSWVLGVSGGLVLATGAVVTLVTLLGSSSSSEEGQESFFLAPAPGGGAVAGVGGRF